MQNIPSHDKTIRLMFIATPGYSIVGGDFSQQEPRLLSDMSGDKQLIDAYKHKRDLYATMAAKIHGNDYWDNMETYEDGTPNPEGKKRRSAIKKLVLAILYGMGADSLSIDLNISKEEAQKLIDDFYAGYPTVYKFIEGNKESVHKYGYVKGILSDLKLESEAEEEIITVIGKKNMLGLKEIAKKYKIPATHLELLNQLPLTFGDREILLKAEKKALNSISKEALERLISLDKLLCENGYGKYVTYDLGLINSISYYSGIVFKGISVHFGSPLLSGGRYDNLLAGFGKDLPAIGFAVGMEHLMLALNYAGLLDCSDEKEIFVGYKKGSEKKAFEICYDYRKKGINASLLFEQNIKNMKKLKSSNPTGEYLYVEQDKAEKIL